MLSSTGATVMLAAPPKEKDSLFVRMVVAVLCASSSKLLHLVVAMSDELSSGHSDDLASRSLLSESHECQLPMELQLVLLMLAVPASALDDCGVASRRSRMSPILRLSSAESIRDSLGGCAF